MSQHKAKYELTLSPGTGVHVGIKLPDEFTDADAAEAVAEGCGLLRIGISAWQTWSDENMTDDERRFKEMSDEQREVAYEQWQEQKAARATARSMLNDELAKRRQ